MKKDVSREKIKKDPSLTAFQKKVLIAVTGIPEGKVRSYAWVAKKTGHPGASRAVGQALKKNPYAPHVPCHRIVASDGSIGGYSRGVAEKKKLLEKEGIKWS